MSKICFSIPIAFELGKETRREVVTHVEAKFGFRIRDSKPSNTGSPFNIVTRGCFVTPISLPIADVQALLSTKFFHGRSTDHRGYSSFTRAQQTQHEPVQVVVTALLLFLFSCGSGTPVVLVRTHPQVSFVLEELV